MRLTFLAIVLSLSLINAFPNTANNKCNFDTVSKDTSKAVSNLALKLYQLITSEKPDDNAIFSPVSIALALALVEAGASGTTQSEIQSFLGSSNANEMYQSLQHQLQIKNDKARLSIANGLFYDNSLKLKNDYVNQVKQCFETQIAEKSFGTNPEIARQQINQWVSDNTAAKIPELLKSGTINRDTVAVLANAIYMKAAWRDQFKQTENLPYNRAGKADQVQNVPFMVQTEHYSYASTDNVQVVELPYDEAPLSMYIVLPKQRNGLRSVEQSLTGDKLISLFNQTKQTFVSLKMPKFGIRSSVTLKTILQQLGLKQMFSDGADFSRMADTGMKVSDAIHEAYIKVDENGTEAAAATALMMAGVSAMFPPPEQPIPFVADRPFIFAIVHKPTMAIAFMGKVNSVEQ